MSLARIKKKFESKRVAFNNSATPLLKRTDIDDLAIIALECNDASLLELFEVLPELALLKKNRTEAQLKRPVAAVGKANETKT